MTVQELMLNLKACGLEEEKFEEYLSNWKSGKTEEQLKLLSEKRQIILDNIHKQEKQINCLDYLVYQIEKGRLPIYLF